MQAIFKSKERGIVADKQLEIMFFQRNNGGCDYYRTELPMNAIHKSKLAKLHKFTQENAFGHMANCIEQSNVIYMPRTSEKQFVDLMKIVKKESKGEKKFVIDWDDNVFHVSPFSPVYDIFGLEEVTVEIDGKRVKLWEDDVNFSIKRNQALHDNIKYGLETCDMVTTTTEILADVFRQYNENVQVLPNALDPKLWCAPDFMPHDGIRMHWGGGDSHYIDWTIIEEALPIVMAKYPQLRLIISGAMFKGTVKKINPLQVEFHDWVHIQAYPYKMALLDIDFAIIPLAENTFNQCKSNIKWAEYGIMATPAITSYLSPYKEAYNGTNGIFVDNSTDAWVNAISEMVENVQLRKDMGIEAMKTVFENYDIEKVHKKWFSIFKSLHECKPVIYDAYGVTI